MKSPSPLRWPQFDRKTDRAVLDILHSGRVNYWTGDVGRRFESEFAKFVGVRRALTVSNGSVALELALQALGVGRGDEVVVTPYSFRASATCAARVGAKMVFADVGEDHLLNAQTIGAVLTPKTKAVVVVHLYGQVVDMGPILALARKRKFFVIEDCAQCLGGEYKGRPVGTLGDVGCYSFCQSKHITAGGEGGMVVARRADVLRKVESLRDHGWTVGSEPKVFDEIGTNARMTEIQCAIGLGELRRFAGWNLPRRRRLADAFAKGLAGHPLVRQCPVDTPDRRASFWLMPFVLDPEKLTCPVATFIERMQKEGALAYKIMWPLMAKKPKATALVPNTVGFWVHPTFTLKDVRHTLAVFHRLTKRTVALLLVALAAGTALAVPQLKMQPEVIADGEIRAKVLSGSRGLPPPTPQARQYVLTRGDEQKTVKWYSVRDLWRLRAFAGEWKDKKGNVMRLARVKSRLPDLPRGEGEKEEIEKALDEAETAFAGEAADLEAWKTAWGGTGTGRIVAVKDRRYYIEFEFAESVKPADAEKLLKTFERSVSTLTSSSGGIISSMRWWETSNPQYRFLTDLDKSKGGKFIKDAMRLMEAMRKSYEFYVPPKDRVGVCVVRVFKTLDGYREYRASTGADDAMSCGLWDPSREELLIVAEDRDQAQGTMRHEAFHQYLHYATRNGRHALWFNEGHACFFESVKYNAANNTVKVTDAGNRAQWVSKDPERYAQAMPKVLKMDRAEFYSGDANLHYCTAWALVYFLEKGAFAADEFEPYRKIVPKYLELTASGVDADTATAQAWAVVEGRDISEDFLRFWKTKRKLASKR